VTLFIPFLPEDRNRPNISNTVVLIYKTRMMDKLQIHTLKHCIILSPNKFKLQLQHGHINIIIITTTTTMITTITTIKKAHTWNVGEETLWKTKRNIKMILKKLLLLL